MLSNNVLSIYNKKQNGDSVMKEKHFDLIRTLLSHENVHIKAISLSNSLDVSVRSIKNYISQLNRVYPNLITSTRNGYLINKDLAVEIINDTSSGVPQNSKERGSFIVNKIFKEECPVNFYDLCEEMYISLSTLKVEIAKLKRRLREFDLKFSIENDFIQIEGMEKNKRKLLSSIIYDESSINFVNLNVIQEAFKDIDISFVKNTVLDVFNQYHYFVNDYSLINLVLHITIATDRIINDNISIKETETPLTLKSHEFELARAIVERLEQQFEIKFTVNETYEMALLLTSRATTIDYRSINNVNIVEYIGKDCLELVEEMMEKIKVYYSIDLNEQEFFIRFALHIRNLLIRSKNNYFSKNPLADGIKSSCPLIYDISVLLAGIINSKIGIKINNDEIAYIAFHLGSALEAQKSLHHKISTVLYCPNYYDLNLKLSQRINDSFSNEILIKNILIDESEFEKISEPDLIIATIPIKNVPEIPTVYTSLFINNKDLESIRRRVDSIKLENKKNKLRSFMHRLIKPEIFEINHNLNSRDETLPYLVEKLTINNFVDQSFLEEIYDREKLSSTAFHSFAIPHSMKMQARKTGICVLISKNPITWDPKPVNLVLMLCFNPQERYIFNEIFEPITNILNEPENIAKLIKCRDAISFIDTIISLTKF